MLKIEGKTITLTRGDSAKIDLEIKDAQGNTYTPQAGDIISFVMKASYQSQDALIEKIIPTNTLELVLAPQDTATLPFGGYVYDIELISAGGGDVDTFIDKGTFIVSEEVGVWLS